MVMDKIPSYLELEIFWDNSRIIEFKVHQDKNKLIKYMNRESTHTKFTFKTIPNGVLNRL